MHNLYTITFSPTGTSQLAAMGAGFLKRLWNVFRISGETGQPPLSV